MTANYRTKTKPRTTPAELADVALIDAATCAAAGGMSLSWWHEEVRAGRAPSPVIRAPRCTRWRLAEVRHFWANLGEAPNAEAEQRLTTQATKASHAARAKRAMAQ